MFALATKDYFERRTAEEESLITPLPSQGFIDCQLFRKRKAGDSNYGIVVQLGSTEFHAGGVGVIGVVYPPMAAAAAAIRGPTLVAMFVASSMMSFSRFFGT